MIADRARPAVERAVIRLTLGVLSRVGGAGTPPTFPASAMGVSFVNAVGLAAGFERAGARLAALARCGFGCIEIGTVRDQAALRTVLSNIGKHSAAMRTNQVRLGLNFAAASERDEVPRQWHALADSAWDAADYLVANLSAPRGMPGDAETLAERTAAIGATHRALAVRRGTYTPVAVKLLLEHVPDNAFDKLRDSGVDAVIGVASDAARIAHAVRALAPLPLISVGGIHDGHDVAIRLAMGAALVQVHAMFSRRGPFFTRRMLNELAAKSATPGVGRG